MSIHFKSCQIMSNHVRSCQITSNHIWSCQIMSNHVKLCQIISNHVKLHQIVSNHVRSHQIASNHVRLRPIMSDRVRLRPITSDCIEVHFNNVNGFLDVDVLNRDVLTFNLLRTFEDQPGANGIKTFYGCNLLILIISYSFCPWQALPAYYNVCR
jgi:hypothetical protein